MRNFPKAFPLVVTLFLSTFAVAHASDERSYTGEWRNASTNEVIGSSKIIFKDENTVTYCFTSKSSEERCFPDFEVTKTDRGLEFGNKQTLYVLTSDGDGYKAERHHRDDENGEFTLANTATFVAE